jgi:hypothetical protein
VLDAPDDAGDLEAGVDVERVVRIGFGGPERPASSATLHVRVA